MSLFFFCNLVSGWIIEVVDCSNLGFVVALPCKVVCFLYYIGSGFVPRSLSFFSRITNYMSINYNLIDKNTKIVRLNAMIKVQT
jgi:hypothetical protein